jgi:hypothetical protein
LPTLSTHSSNAQLSTPLHSPTPDSSSNGSGAGLIDPTGVNEDFSSFNLNPQPQDLTLLDSPTESLYSVADNLCDHLFSVQLGSTEFQFARDQLHLYDVLLDVHTGPSFRRLPADDRRYLLDLASIEYPSPPPSTLTQPRPTIMADPRTIIIADKNYSIAKLQGQDDYQVWRIQMEDMFQDVEVWDIVNGTSPRLSVTADMAAWDKKSKAALGVLRRRVDIGPMIHIARCTTVPEAWNILRNQYQSLGIAAMTMLRNKFTSMRMAEGDDLESHIKDLRKIFNDLNIALLSERSKQLKEIEFIRQLLVSLPESWQILVSVIPQQPETTDQDSAQLSANVQSRLLAEYHRRKSQSGEQSFYARNRSVPGSSRNRSNTAPVGRIEIICHKCNIPGHKRPECCKPGGGAYKTNVCKGNNANRGRGNNRHNNANRSNNNNNNNNNNRNRQDNNNPQNNGENNGECANYASNSEFGFSFRFTGPLCRKLHRNPRIYSKFPRFFPKTICAGFRSRDPGAYPCRVAALISAKTPEFLLSRFYQYLDQYFFPAGLLFPTHSF